MVRSPEGDKFYLIATDLSIYYRGGWGSANATVTGSKNLVIWESTDLVNWSDPRLVDVASGIPNDPAAGVQGEDTLQLVRSIVYGAIWIPYMRVSRRVRNTFGASDPARRRERREPVFASPTD